MESGGPHFEAWELESMLDECLAGWHVMVVELADQQDYTMTGLVDPQSGKVVLHQEQYFKSILGSRVLQLQPLSQIPGLSSSVEE